MRTLLLTSLTLSLAGYGLAQTGEEAVAIAADEDARRADAARWTPRLAADDRGVRRMAVRAVGRIRDAELAPLLAKRVGAEVDESVRVELVFALGQLKAGREALVAACSDASPAVRAAAIEALGKLPAEVSSAACFANGLSGDPTEVAAAFLACARAYGRRVQPQPEVPEALAAPLVEAALAQLDGELAWQASYALSEVVGLANEAALLKALAVADSQARVFAARGLARLDALTPAGREALHAALTAKDPHAASAAAWALGKHPDPASQSVLKAAAAERTEQTGFHVRAAALQALASSFPERPGEAWLSAFERGTQDPSPTVRRVALAALAGWGALIPDHVARFAGESSTAADRQSLAMAAGALGELPPELARAFLGSGLEGAERAALAEALVELDTRWVAFVGDSQGPRGFVQAVLEASALAKGGRLAALDTLAKHYTSSLPAARQGKLFHSPERDTLGDPLSWAEVRAAVVSAAQTILQRERWFAPLGDASRGRALLLRALDDPDGGVREAAADALGDLYGARPTVAPRVPVPSSVPFNAADADPQPLRAVLRTELGPLTLELLPRQAPRHVKSFVRLAEVGFYDGLTIHRVVTGFVAQGLCPLGNGWGTGGVHLNDEINRIPYRRGAVGMPSSGPDTAGCQVFITHVPTPHLDGNYTVFARVIDGWDVLDALDLDDVIEGVELKR